MTVSILTCFIRYDALHVLFRALMNAVFKMCSKYWTDLTSMALNVHVTLPDFYAAQAVFLDYII